MSDGPKRYESDLTIVIPRDALPPTAGPISHPPLTIEHLADLARAARDEEEDRREADTLVECPCCDGVGMVLPERRPELLALLATETTDK